MSLAHLLCAMEHFWDTPWHWHLCFHSLVVAQPDMPPPPSVSMASSGPETLLFLGQRMGDGCHLTLSSHPAQENIGTRLAQAVTKGADTKFPERSRADWKHGNRKRLNGKIAGEARGVPTYPTVHLGSLVWGGRSLVRNISASNPPPKVVLH